MVKKNTKRNKKRLIVVSVLLVALLAIGLLIFSNLTSTKQTQYFNDENLGLVTIKSGEISWLSALFSGTKQAVVFTPTSAELGATVSLRDDYKVPYLELSTGQYVQPWSIDVKKSGSYAWGISGLFSKPYGSGSALWINAYFTPSSAGTYNALTTYYKVSCAQSFPTPSNCQSISATPFTSPSTNTVTITKPYVPPVCSKSAYWSSWSRDTEISGGYYDKRIYYTVDGNCEYAESNSEYRTTCSDGYYITGTTNSIGSGSLSCELIPAPITDCNVDPTICSSSQVCDNSACVEKECNADITLSCPATNANIVTKSCVNYRLIDTGATCPTTATYYRFANNACTSMNLDVSQKTANDYTSLAECQTKIVTTPTAPQPSGFAKFLQALITWFKNLFTGTQQTILGQTNIEPNTQQTYSVAITAPVPDSDYSDGNYSIQYANWALVSSSGNILQQGAWEQVQGSYSKSVTILTPSNIGDYVLLGVITQYDMTYNGATHTWSTSEERVVNKEAINLINKYNVTAPTNPQPSGFSKFIASIINFFKTLFGIN